MKKVITLLTVAILLCGTALFSSCNDGEEPKVKGTVAMPVNAQYELSNLFDGKDNLFNVSIKTPANESYKIHSRQVVFTMLGTYQFIHSDGSITNVEVKDEVSPSIYLNLMGYEPKLGEETSLPFLAVDNYDGDEITVRVTSSGAETNNRFTPLANGTDLVISAMDKSNNVSEVKINLVSVGTTFTASNLIFGAQDVSDYAVSYKITECSQEGNISYLGNSEKAQKGKYYIVTAMAKNGSSTLTATEYYIPML